MMASILTLLLFLVPQAKQLIDNQRVMVWESTGQVPENAGSDRVVVDLAKPGDAVFVKKGEPLPKRPHAIVIAIKDVKIAPTPNNTRYPLAFPREGVKKVLENDRVVIWDYTWIKGRPTVMHFHDKDVVVVYMADGKLKSTTVDGMSTINDLTFGKTTFNAPNRTHSEELVEGSARAVITEFK